MDLQSTKKIPPASPRHDVTAFHGPRLQQEPAKPPPPPWAQGPQRLDLILIFKNKGFFVF